MGNSSSWARMQPGDVTTSLSEVRPQIGRGRRLCENPQELLLQRTMASLLEKGASHLRAGRPVHPPCMDHPNQSLSALIN